MSDTVPWGARKTFLVQPEECLLGWLRSGGLWLEGKGVAVMRTQGPLGAELGGKGLSTPPSPLEPACSGP